jgi:hypothetical protein
MKYQIEKVNGDNRRPGMKHPDGYLIRYRPHPDFGWTGCRTVPTEDDAKAFAATLNEHGDISN